MTKPKTQRTREAAEDLKKQIQTSDSRAVHSSKYRGVSWHKHVKKWQAMHKGEHLGYFDNEEDAYHAYLSSVNNPSSR